MSDAIIPEEQLPAFHRWQLASFDASRPEKQDAASPDEAARAREQSREVGYNAGYEQGRKRAEEEVQRLHGLVLELQAALTGLDQTVADQLLSLALDIARQMLGQALAVRPELVLPVIEEAVRCVSQDDEAIRVVLHPEDAALVRTHLAACPGKEWVLVEDAFLARGGCRVATHSTEVDATLPGRWRRVLANLGNTDDWLRT